MSRNALLPLLVAAAPLALAESPKLRCGAVADAGTPGSGLAQRQCVYGGASLADAYRRYLEHERTGDERAPAAHLLPARLPERDARGTVNEQAHYRVSWQGHDQVQVVLTQDGDLPSSQTYHFRRKGDVVEITRLYEAP